MKKYFEDYNVAIDYIMDYYNRKKSRQNVEYLDERVQLTRESLDINYNKLNYYAVTISEQEPVSVDNKCGDLCVQPIPYITETKNDVFGRDMFDDYGLLKNDENTVVTPIITYAKSGGTSMQINIASEDRTIPKEEEYIYEDLAKVSVSSTGGIKEYK